MVEDGALAGFRPAIEREHELVLLVIIVPEHAHAVFPNRQGIVVPIEKDPAFAHL